jgi:hypothetical protein
MKMMVKLAVLLATLLLLTTVAFAQSFDYFACYEITYTNLDNPDDKETIFAGFIFDFEANEGYFEGICGESGNLSLFFDSMRKQALAYSIYGSVAYLKFHGDWLNIVTGIAYCNGNSRYEFKGHQSDKCIL